MFNFIKNFKKRFTKTKEFNYKEFTETLKTLEDNGFIRVDWDVVMFTTSYNNKEITKICNRLKQHSFYWNKFLKKDYKRTSSTLLPRNPTKVPDVSALRDRIDLNKYLKNAKPISEIVKSNNPTPPDKTKVTVTFHDIEEK